MRRTTANASAAIEGHVDPLDVVLNTVLNSALRDASLCITKPTLFVPAKRSSR